MKIVIHCKIYLSSLKFYVDFISRILFFLLFCIFQIFTIDIAKCESIQVHSQELYKIRKSLKEKELEKNNLILKEKIFKKEIKVLSCDIERTEEKLEKCLSDIKSVQFNLKKFLKNYEDASMRRANWNKIMIIDINFFNKMTFMFSYEQNPMAYKIKRECLEYEKKKIDKEKKYVAISTLNIKRCGKLKKNLLDLQYRENKLVTKHKNIFLEKSKYLKTTLNKRLMAEKEIKILNDSARALQNLIDKINLANKQKQRSMSVQQIKIKKSFSWPVDGEIVVSFGRNRHPELDTCIISNGIKINAANFSSIKSINSGTVVFTGSFRTYGKIIIIDHKNEIFAIYGLLNKIFVKEGEVVPKEKIIAELGSGEHGVLYFEIRYKNIPDNPVLWLKAK
ncbi:MAG: peptidoglycan DD-metalloendopeptidase family protein [Endomicrobium sp.]|jgi:murein DD-endopeptidase MepM/ murein hydrolase activator NlpD|nr:peptidoglycan DD-metalloendopeptidase family protein [Endomicrobium sp.]